MRFARLIHGKLTKTDICPTFAQFQKSALPHSGKSNKITMFRHREFKNLTTKFMNLRRLSAEFIGVGTCGFGLQVHQSRRVSHQSI
jgi:hypothetical protein